MELVGEGHSEQRERRHMDTQEGGWGWSGAGHESRWAG